MRRREFITLLGGAAAIWPLAAGAQQPRKIARVGYLGPLPNNPMIVASYSVISSELRQFGFVEGQNLTVEYRYHNVPGGDIATQAVELAQSDVDVIVADGPEAVLQAAVGASRTIPIAMIAINFDPIARSYVSSLARPGGNITGIFFEQLELAQKQLELLTQALPGKTKAAALYDALSVDQFTAAKRAAETMTLEFYGLKLENPPYDFDAAFRVLAQDLPICSWSCPALTSRVAARELLRLQFSSACPPCSLSGLMLRPEGLCPTARTTLRCIAELLLLSEKFSGGCSPPTFPSSSRQNSNWWSISKQPRQLVLRCRYRSWCAPTR